MADTEAFRKNFGDIIEGVVAIQDAEQEVRDQAATRFIGRESIHSGTPAELYEMGRQATDLLAVGNVDPDFILFEQAGFIERMASGGQERSLVRGWLVSRVQASSSYEKAPGAKDAGSYRVARHDQYYLVAGLEGHHAIRNLARSERYFQGPELIADKAPWGLEFNPEFVAHAAPEHNRSFARIPRIQEDLVRLLQGRGIL